MKEKVSLIEMASTPMAIEPWQRDVLAAAHRYSISKRACMTLARPRVMRSKEWAELIAAQRALLQIAAALPIA